MSNENNETTGVVETSNPETFTKEDTVSLIREAMTVDEQIDELKAHMQTLLQERHVLLGNIAKRGVKRFAWKGLPLTIWRKGEGIFSLKGKKKSEDLDILSID